MAKRILSIDDEEVIRLVLEIHLSGAGHELTTVDTGAKGLQLACDQHFDLILCDIRLEEENGLDIIKALKQFRKTTPVIALTGLIGDEVVELVKKSGADSYIAKPFTRAELFSTIDQFLHNGVPSQA